MSMNIELTTEPAMSIYGQPVLRIRTANGCEDYGPDDLIAEESGRKVVARDVVFRWLAEPERTAEDVELGRRFLGWHSGGPPGTK
jgi:hypothetical protein